MADTEADLTAELEAIEDVQQRVDRVAQDLASGKHRYASVDAWTLGELLDWGWENMRGWDYSHWAYRSDPEDDCCEFPFAENVECLKGQIDDQRFKELEECAADLLENGGDSDIDLTEKEITLLKDAYAEERASDCSALEFHEKSLKSTEGVELPFQVCVGDGGEPCEVHSPYEIKNGNGFDTSQYVECL